jgi:hypothetical protein
MTETEWQGCEKPCDLIVYLRETMPVSKGARRKVRLLLAAFCRRVWDRFTDPGDRTLVELSERYADGAVAFGALKAAWDAGRTAGRAFGRRRLWARLACSATHRDVWQGALETWATLSLYGTPRGNEPLLQDSEQAELIRDVFGLLPFRPPVADSRWLTRDVRALARAAYEERSLPEGALDQGRLAVLADALEDAGCGEAIFLAHLRDPGRHVRGCWVLDLILGKK